MHWLSWDRLCQKKCEGGLGFRHLQSLNTTLLGKQVWRLLSSPNALLCSLLRAKYFPLGDLMGATEGHNPSLIWRGWYSLKRD